ncbi:mannose-ethanolamine phosphotransferase gpi13 [Phlyctochytrium bullatum]|nr:mannose-ethanolamine phosphotransferase gpi13 [Phlyctochytrium bullatum]
MFQRKARVAKAVSELKALKSSSGTKLSTPGAANGGATAVVLKNLTLSNWFLPRLSIILFTLLLLHAIGIFLFSSGFLLSRLELDTANGCSLDDLDAALAALDREVWAGDEERLKAANRRESAGCWMEQRFKRAVFIVVDALRFDFADYNETLDALSKSGETVPYYINKLPVFRNLLRDHPERSFLARVRADAPTTTLQRLKALTTGTLPTFVDAGSNFGGSVIAEDNILDQLVRLNRSIAFMGDDTWVGLYPTQMNESHPYPSFNVQDLHTVDNGCVEHIFPLLERTEKNWDVAIAHFLGVDHVGHSFGPYTIPMATKLTQLNGWLEKIFWLLDEETVAFVIGDHGMDPKGDHGGDSENEVNAALFVFSGGKKLVEPEYSNGKVSTDGPLSKVLKRIGEVPFEGGEPYAYMNSHRTLPQIDFVPTLSLLMGLPIPFGNLGSLIPELFYVSDAETGNESEALRRLLEATRLNARQIYRYLDDYSKQRTSADFDLPELRTLFTKAEDLFSQTFSRLNDAQKGAPLPQLELDKAWDAYFNYVLFTRQALVAARRIWARFDIPLIVMGIIILVLSVVSSIAFALSDWSIMSFSLANSSTQSFAFGLRPSFYGFLAGFAGGASLGYFTNVAKAFISALPIDSEDSVLNKLHEVLFSAALTAQVCYLVIAFYETRRFVRKSTKPLEQSPTAAFTLGVFANLFLGILLLILYAVVPASNSFTIHDESVTAYLLQGFGAFTLSASFSAENDEARGSLIMHSLLFMILTRISQMSTICREETMQAMMCYPTFNFLPNSSVASPQALLALIILIPIVVGSLRASLKSTENLHSTGSFIMDYCVPIGLSISAAYWSMDTLEGHHFFSGPGDVWADRMKHVKIWWAKLGFLSMGSMCLYVWGSDPICIGLKKEIVRNTQSVAPDGSDTATVRLRLFGVRNAIGSAYMVFVSVAYMILVMFQKPMGGVMLGVEMLQILCLVQIIAVWREDAAVRQLSTDKKAPSKDSGPTDTSDPTSALANSNDWYDFSLLVLHGTVLMLIGQRGFFATGHQATISSIQWELAFVGLYEVNWYISPIMVALNTFGGPILALLSCPLLPIWRRPLVAKTQDRTVKELGWTVMWHVISTSIVATLATALCGHFRRHLMVWKIFAPKFIYADVTVLLIGVLASLGVVGAVWLPWVTYRVFLDTMEKKGLL